MTSEYPRPLPLEIVDEIVARHSGGADRTGDVLGILEEAQRAHPQNYLPAQTYADVARKTGLPPSQIMSVVTFYAFFNRRPQGRHTLTVCRGTACHTRGSRQLLEAIRGYVGVHDDRGNEASDGPAGNDDRTDRASAFTTPDGRLTVRTVACFGQCAQAPVVAIDAAMHGHVSDFVLRALVTAIDGDEGAAVPVDAVQIDETRRPAAQESAR